MPDTPTPADIELPALPSFDGFTERQMRGGLLTTGAYFTATLQNFARAAILADRARTAASCAPTTPPASQRDELLQASLDIISTLTGMQPPPIETAPPEVFAPFYEFVDRVQVIVSAQKQQGAVAWVPVHPKNGPLWANATADPNPERLPSYPLMPLYAAHPVATPDPIPEGCTPADARKLREGDAA